jgi:hypothetical protein
MAFHIMIKSLYIFWLPFCILSQIRLESNEDNQNGIVILAAIALVGLAMVPSLTDAAYAHQCLLPNRLFSRLGNPVHVLFPKSI